MGYKVLGKFEDVMQGFGPRRGLEGPFNFNGRVLYYDNSVGQYYDPRTDFYVEQDEMDIIHNRIYDILKG